MPKNKSCNLTKSEWKYLLDVFQEHTNNSDDPDKSYKKLREIHMKVFFMDALVKQQMEEENAETEES